MKNIISFFIMFLAVSKLITAQTADEIIENYFETIGGKEKLESLEGIKIELTQSAQGMEYPVEVVQLSDGRQYAKISIQGNEIFDGVYDGETLWGTNFMTMKPEKKDAESLQNYLNNDAKEFPDVLLNYADKGYSIELLESEEIDGVDCHKIQLTKIPLIEAGEEKENIAFYYFDKESGLLIAQKSEEDTGMGKIILTNIFGDFDEVDGIIFPFSSTSYHEGKVLSQTTFENIELNPDVNDEVFKYQGE